MKLIAVVGSIGSGKSWICNQLPDICDDNKLHVHRIDLDQISKSLFHTNELLRNELVANFGPIMVNNSVIKKRKYVIEQIMSNDVLYTKMNNIIIPYMIDWLESSIQIWKDCGFDLVVVEGAALIHSNELLAYFDSIIHVEVSKEVCQRRVQERALYTDRQFEILYKRSTPSTTIGFTTQPVYLITNNECDKSGVQIKNILTSEFSANEKVEVDNNNSFANWLDYIKELRLEEFCNIVDTIPPSVPVESPDTSYSDNDLTKIVKIPEKVVIYPGSFNPLHIGHIAVVEDLLRMFDKVILLKCINGGKSSVQPNIDFDINKLPVGCEAQQWNGAFVDYIIAHTDKDVVIARGIRNSVDFEYEVSYIKHLTEQCKFRGEIMPPVVYVPCRDEYKHISSSSIRAISQFDTAYANSLMV